MNLDILVLLHPHFRLYLPETQAALGHQAVQVMLHRCRREDLYHPAAQVGHGNQAYQCFLLHPWHLAVPSLHGGRENLYRRTEAEETQQHKSKCVLHM